MAPVAPASTRHRLQAGIGSVVGVARDLVVSAGRDFVISSYRDGRVRTAGLPAGVRVAVLSAVGVVVLLIVSIVAADAWRTGVDPVVVSGGQALRGTLVPAPLVPITFAILAFAAALCVSGALRAGPLVAASVALVYFLLATFVHELTIGDDLLHRVAGWAVPAVPALFVLVRRLRPRPTAELLVSLGLVGLTFADAHRLLAATDRAGGTDFLSGQTSLLLHNILFLSTPLLVVAALDVVDFGATAARWGLRFVDVRLGQRTVLTALVALGAWRGKDLLAEQVRRFDDLGAIAQLRGMVGSVALVGALLLVIAGLRRVASASLADADPQEMVEASRRVSLPLAMLLVAIELLLALGFLVILGGFYFLGPDDLVDVLDWVSENMVHLGAFGAGVWWDLLRAAVTGLAAWTLARRGRVSAAAFLATVAVFLVDASLTDPGRVLDDWAWTLSGIDLLAVGATLALLARWAIAGTLTERRTEWGLYLLLLTGLLRQATFISDPLAPFLAFTGGAFVLFGLVWGFATGGAWANEGSAKLPRLTRVQLLLGYQVLSTAILHWYLVSHELGALEQLTEDLPGTGTALLGQPLLLVLFLSALASALGDVEVDAGDEESPEDPPVRERPLRAAQIGGLDVPA